MTLPAIERGTRSANYFTPDRCQARYGQPRRITSITIHWWGDPAQKPQFNGMRDWLCRAGGNTSAHYVVESGRVAEIISPENAAWHAGSAKGNASSIGIECNPRAHDGDYETVADLVSHLRGIYGDLPLVPHRDWSATSCPGNYDLGRIDALARGITGSAGGTQASTGGTPSGPNLAVDGSWGPATTRAIQAVVGVSQDGNFGPDTTRALQRHLNRIHENGGDGNAGPLSVDGSFGPETKRLFQGYLGVEQDGSIGPATIKALQIRLNERKF